MRAARAMTAGSQRATSLLLVLATAGSIALPITAVIGRRCRGLAQSNTLREILKLSPRPRGDEQDRMSGGNSRWAPVSVRCGFRPREIRLAP